nr:RHS repeat-associated core domain-containing protein [uncultured Carboxylicivirga sp.]
MKKILVSVCLLLCGLMAMIAQESQKNYVLKNQETGNKTYVARDYVSLKPGFSYTASAGNSFLAKIDQCLLFPPTDATYKTPEGDVTSDPALGGVVGSIPGQFSVTPSGAATYTIPIECPPGINGMQPNISLSYNSQGGNGIAGWGFNIGGISSISRIGNNLYNDNSVSGINYYTDDNLVLDGQRLILISGTNLTVGAKYRTEQETFSDIVCKLIDGHVGFEITAKDGYVKFYGITDDSNIKEQNGNVCAYWLLKKVKDNYSNFINYNYEKNVSTGEFNLLNITYGGNETAGTNGGCTIDFIYDVRDDSSIKYISGSAIAQTKILSSVKSSFNDETYREYVLNYKYDGFYNKLSEVTKIGSDGSQLNPTVINWSDLDQAVAPSMSIETIDTDIAYLNSSLDQSVMFLDFNNDGFPDFIQPSFDPLNYAYVGWEMYVSTNNGSNFILHQNENMDNNPSKFPFEGDYQLLPIDINKDGITDLIEARSIKDFDGSINGYEIDVLLTIDGDLVRQNLLWNIETSGQATFLLNDFTGDGEIEMLVKNELFKLNWNNKTITSLFVSSNMMLGQETRLTDINGNSIPDLYSVENGNVYEYNSEIGDFVEITFNNRLFGYESDLEFGDFNGDGITDVLEFKRYEQTWHIWISSGNDFIELACPLDRIKSDDELYFIGDYNGDGNADVLEIIEEDYNSYTLNLYYYNGSEFISATHTIFRSVAHFYKNNTIPYYDINGDGTIDLMALDYDNSFCVSFTTSETERRVSSIKNGLGQTSEIRYKPLTDNTIYSEGETSHQADVIHPCFPINVVSSVNSSGGSSNLSLEFEYEGFSLHTKGKGALGFKKFTQKNNTQNVKAVTEYGYNTNYFNIYPVSETITTLSNEPISTTTYTNDVIEYSSTRIYPYVSSYLKKDELTGLQELVEILDIDDYGNVEIKCTTKGNLIETETVAFVQAGGWCLNKPSTVTVQKTLDGESVTRVTNYIYNTEGNLDTETIDPADVNQLTKTVDYDSFGNPVYIERTANGITQSTSLEYTTSGRFLKKSTDNSTTFYTSFVFSELSGQLLSETNHLGLTTTHEYNGLGNLLKTTYPDGRYLVNSSQWSDGDGPIGAVYYTYEEKSGQSPSWTWFDELGQVLRTESYGLDDTKKIIVDTEYDNLGNVASVSKPYFSGESKENELAFNYDQYGREIQRTTPFGDIVTSYKGLEKTINGPDGTKVEVLNEEGLLTSSTINDLTVSYTYWPTGAVKSSLPEGGTSVQTEYDLQGNRIRLSDPDLGVVISSYNGYGDVLWTETLNEDEQGNAVTKRTTYGYDTARRITSVNCNGEVTTYSYSSETGFLLSELVDGHEVQYLYDENGTAYLGRITSKTEVVDGVESFVHKMEYDAFGRIKKEIYPSGFSIINSYTANGYLAEVKQSNGSIIWKAEEANARGQLLRTRKGNNITTFGYDSRGLPTSIYANNSIDHSYNFNAQGNLEYREDFSTLQREDFSYDTRNQLTGWTVSKNGVNVADNSMTYDSNGNILSKSDLGVSFGYNHPLKAHALTSLSGNPALISDEVQDITYTDFNKVHTISEGNANLVLNYGVNKQRVKGVFDNDGSILTRYYVGNYEEDRTASGVKKMHYISGGDGIAAIYIVEEEQSQLVYAYCDLLGSLTALTDADGNIVNVNGTDQKFAYDPWGNRRDPFDWTSTDVAVDDLLTSRGYTMHEHLDAFVLINMNGRVYDPQLGRFLSPDPYLQSPGNALNYNRYAYCLNNPFLYTDPTGYNVFKRFWNWCKENKEVVVAVTTIVVAVVVTVATAGAGSPLLVAAIGGAAGGFAGGTLGGLLDGKDIWSSLGDGLIQGAIGAVSGYVGGALGQWAAKGGLSLIAGAGYTIQSPVLKGALGGFFGGAVGGFGGGFTAGFAGAMIATGDWETALNAGWDAGVQGAKMGGAIGTVAGSFTGYKYAKDNNLNPWSGKSLRPKVLTENGIYGTQKGLNSDIADNYLDQMKSGTFDESKAIGGFKSDGKYYIGDGHHRMNAAYRYYLETGDSYYVNHLIRTGRWTPSHPSNYGLKVYKLD